MTDPKLRLACLKIAAADYQTEKEKQSYSSGPTSYRDVTSRADMYYEWVTRNREHYAMTGPRP